MNKRENIYTPTRTVKFKMYKAKKQWMMAALAFMAGAAMMTGQTIVSADTTDAQPVTQTSENSSQESSILTIQDSSSDNNVNNVTNGSDALDMDDRSVTADDTSSDDSNVIDKEDTSTPATDDNSMSLSKGQTNSENPAATEKSASQTDNSFGSDNNSQVVTDNGIGTQSVGKVVEKTVVLQNEDDLRNAMYTATGKKVVVGTATTLEEKQKLIDMYVGAQANSEANYDFSSWKNFSVNNPGISLQGTGRPLKTALDLQPAMVDGVSAAHLTGTYMFENQWNGMTRDQYGTIIPELTQDELNSFTSYVQLNSAIFIDGSASTMQYHFGSYISVPNGPILNGATVTGYFEVYDSNNNFYLDSNGNALALVVTNLKAGVNIYNGNVGFSFGGGSVTYTVTAPTYIEPQYLDVVVHDKSENKDITLTLPDTGEKVQKLIDFIQGRAGISVFPLSGLSAENLWNIVSGTFGLSKYELVRAEIDGQSGDEVSFDSDSNTNQTLTYVVKGAAVDAPEYVETKTSVGEPLSVDESDYYETKTAVDEPLSVDESDYYETKTAVGEPLSVDESDYYETKTAVGEPLSVDDSNYYETKTAVGEPASVDESDYYETKTAVGEPLSVDESDYYETKTAVGEPVSVDESDYYETKTAVGEPLSVDESDYYATKTAVGEPLSVDDSNYYETKTAVGEPVSVDESDYYETKTAVGEPVSVDESDYYETKTAVDEPLSVDDSDYYETKTAVGEPLSLNESDFVTGNIVPQDEN
ncbi:KxYKxGKxW signal peptide domain-containing protein, partial [Leuconostoc falkenbergense]|uniref:KxYKxGKxW signal peptide domain-containing protein n=1 Tax=Leuconostoc falkenbergense TaxID=2766470 RepID=UPI0024ADA55A